MGQLAAVPREMNRLLDRFTAGFGFPFGRSVADAFPAPAFGSSFALTSPAVDITEDATAYKIAAKQASKKIQVQAV
jgi:hypothetical protein